MARKFFFTSYEVFFLPQFSTLMTLPPSRCTMPRMRSTILSTRSSARSGFTRKSVSYSRSRVPGACCGGAAVACASVIVSSPHGIAAVELVGHREGSFVECCDGRICCDRDVVLQLFLFFQRKSAQNPIRAFPLLRRPADSESHPDRLASEVLPDAAQAVVPRVAAALLHLDASELQVDLVVDHRNFLLVHLVEPGRLPHRLAAQVHVVLREDDHRVARRRDHGAPPLAPAARAQLSRRLLCDAKADVVARALVLRAGIAQAHQQAHGLLLAALVARGGLR